MTNFAVAPEEVVSLSLFEELQKFEHEQLVFCSDPKVGLKAIIAIHNTTLGPALGGTRMWTYATDNEAIIDALRLSRGMTYKAAVARLNLGGGKAVIIGDSKKHKSEALFRTYGRFVEGLAGRYITAEDVGTDVRDMEMVRMETKYVTGISRALGGSGDPSPVTALGVYMGMKAACAERYGNDSLSRKVVIVQGAGQVAYHLCGYLRSEGAIVKITDIFEEKARRIVTEYGAEYVKPDEIFNLEGAIFCPAALGGVLNSDTIPKLKVDIVAGCANNQLKDEGFHEQMLIDKGILYVPDFVINSGGLINVANELEGYNRERALSQVKEIYDVIRDILRVAKRDNILPNSAAIALAEDRLQKIGMINNIYAGVSRYNGRLGEMNNHRTK
ncbi:MAG: Glu/Leu/Phe/Val dehydrogenase [Chloroherpetonaceae bacterium]|nr:Glu/Leu/Phe/Val dehydrogenase [Chloroherpetonaceae bacterium]